MKNFIQKAKTLHKMMSSNEGTLFTYAFAYSIIVGVAPFLIIAVVFVGTYAYDVNQIVMFLQRYVPRDLIEPFVTYIQASQFSNIWLIISLLGVSVWVASKSIYSFLLLSSEQDEVNISGMILRILSVAYFVLLLLGLTLVGFVVNYISISSRFVMPILLLLFFTVFYRLLSFRFTRFKDVFPGAFVTSVVLTLLGRLFFVYINGYSNYETIYGPLASMMIMLISGWFISWVIFLGYCINLVMRGEEPRRAKNRLINFLEEPRLLGKQKSEDSHETNVD